MVKYSVKERRNEKEREDTKGKWYSRRNFMDKRKTIENGVLLRHIIDNDLKHIWRLIFVLVGLIAGLYAKTFIGGKDGGNKTDKK